MKFTLDFNEKVLEQVFNEYLGGITKQQLNRIVFTKLDLGRFGPVTMMFLEPLLKIPIGEAWNYIDTNKNEKIDYDEVKLIVTDVLVPTVLKIRDGVDEVLAKDNGELIVKIAGMLDDLVGDQNEENTNMS